MKHFSIDEDTMNALMELLSDAYITACDISDKGSEQFYAYLLGELENATIVGKSKPLDKDEEIKMKKLERYLRMLQKGLLNPDNDRENKKRRDYARDMLDKDNNIPKVNPEKDKIVEVTNITPYFSKNMSLENVENMIKKMSSLSDLEKFKLYCTERDNRTGSNSLDKLCKDVGIKRAKK